MTYGTARELEVLALFAQGMTRKEVSARLGIAERTVINHLQHLYLRLDVHNSHEAMWVLGWVTPHPVSTPDEVST